MKNLRASLGDLAVFWVIVVLAYGVVGFLRGRHTVRRWSERFRWRRDLDL